MMSPMPAGYHRLKDGDRIDIGGRRWRIAVGSGHSPEHACLVSEDGTLMISGDQVLPRISSNVSVYAAEPLRSEEDTSELQSLMRISEAAFCWTTKNKVK